jgi:hypothetical protein
MDKKNPLWKRAFGSMKTFFVHPLGGGKGKQAPPLEELQVPIVPPQPVRKRLWGQDFAVVDEGLAEDQIVAFVDGLVNKCRGLEEQQRHFLSLGSLTERAAVEADKAAAGIRARAKAEAEAESARIVAEASQRTQEMLAQAKRTAQEASRQEVQTILQTALKKAAIVELQAKQQAQLFLIRSRDAVENDLREEVKEAYYRLLSGLHNVLGEGNKLEMEWKGKTGELRRRDAFELEGYEVVRSALSAEIARTSPLIGGEVETGVGIASWIDEGNGGS